MDVTCDRCNTRYEFDAALVSNRGTTVKCTNCGHQFRVFRPQGLGDFGGWTIRTVDGRELSFRAMRELQAAITHGEISTEDVLIPGDRSEPRRLGKIEELQSFFAAEVPDHVTIRRTATRGDTQPPRFDDEISLLQTNVVGSGSPNDLASNPGTRVMDRDGEPVPSRSGDTLKPPPRLPPTPPISARGSGQAPAPGSERTRVRPPPAPKAKAPAAPPRAAVRSAAPHPEPPTLKGSFEPRHVPSPQIPADKPSASTNEAVEALNRAVNDMLEGEGPSSIRGLGDDARVLVPSEDGAAPELGDEDAIGEPSELPPSEPAVSSSLPPLSPTSSVMRPSVLRRSEFTDPRFSAFSPRGKRPGTARWIVGLIGAGCLMLVGFTLFRRYVLPTAPAPAASSVQENERVSQLLDEGDGRLLAGDVEGAKEHYLKASGISESDPRISRGVARIEIIRADLVWLHMRLLSDDAPERAGIGQQLASAIARADEALARAIGQAPSDASNVGLSIDVLRLKGKGEEARKLVPRLPTGSADGGRVIAALDLIESGTNYSAVIDRLRTAIRDERKLGRAHAMLIYALVRAGKVEDAAAELEALKSQSPAHYLIAPLKRFIDDPPTEAADSDSASSADAEDGDAPTSYKEALQRAGRARKDGDLDRAQKLYEAALEKKPGDDDALAGLAEVARDRGDIRTASKRYQQILDENPRHVVALIGLADITWASGKRQDAVKLYKQVVKADPDGAHAKHARARIEAAKSAAASPAPAQPTPDPEPVRTSTPPDTSDLPDGPKPQPAPSPAPDGVDVTDLPEYHE